MSRLVLVSNRVLDWRKAAQAGGMAVALADVARERKGDLVRLERRDDGRRACRRGEPGRPAPPPCR